MKWQKPLLSDRKKKKKEGKGRGNLGFIVLKSIPHHEMTYSGGKA